MSVTIRRASPGDAAALGVVLSDWIDATDWMPRLYTREQDRAFVGHLIAEGAVTVAEDAGDVGFLCRDGEEITALYLAPALRGKGAGAALVAHAKQRRDRLSLWTFQANAGAIRFYGRQGFVETDRSDGDNAEGLPDLQMTWERR